MGDETTSRTKPEPALDSQMLAKVAGSAERRLGCRWKAEKDGDQGAEKVPGTASPGGPGQEGDKIVCIQLALLEVTDGTNQGSTGSDSLDGLLDTVKAMNYGEACSNFLFCSTEERCSSDVGGQQWWTATDADSG